MDQRFTSNADISWNEPFYIGRRWNHDNDAYWFNGIIDDIRLFNRPLSSEEIEILYLNTENAVNPNPSDGQKNIDRDVILSWSPVDNIAIQEIYFGTSYNNINIATRTSIEFMGCLDVNQWDTNNYSPAGLDFNTTYYWRIDEAYAEYKLRGDVWTFTTKLKPNLVSWLKS